jgi:hypothetical protein
MIMTPSKTISVSLFVLAILLSASACHQRIDPARIGMLNSTLIRANKNIHDENDRIYTEIAQSFSDPQKTSLAMHWAPTAIQVMTLSQSAKISIDSLALKWANIHELTFVEQNKLFNVLVAYRQNIQHIFNTDSVGLSQEILKADTARINQSLPILYGYSDTIANEYSKNWIDSIFGSDDEEMLLAALNKVKNDVSFSENKLISYCYKQIQVPILDGSAIWPVTWQSAIHVKAGDSIDISAGIGVFSRLAKMRISIDDLPTSLNESNLAVRTIKTGSRPGQHTVPVTMEYTKPDGSTSQVTKMLAYYVQD